MWTRSKLKEVAKEALHRNYWKIVLVSVILVLLGCETGGMTFRKTTYQYNEEEGAREMHSVAAPTGKKSIVTVRKRTDSDKLKVETIGGGQFPAEDVEISFFEGMFIGFVAVTIFLILFAIVLAIILVVDIFLINPLGVGGKRFMIKSVEDVAQVKEIAYGFDHSYKNIVKVMFHRELRIFLWTLLFIVPGIIKMYEYYMVPYILSEHPDMEYGAALQMSRDMMDGNKWKTFVLGLSFILWDILGALTFGIVEVLYVQPYRSLTFAALYCRLRNMRVMNAVNVPTGGQYGVNGQRGVDAPYGVNGQYGVGDPYSVNGQRGVDVPYGQNGQYGTNGNENGQQW
ncbi:MAG: DUF975 family protein [Lachnospiraceae bacterium]|nr:DUF975 family protein [Lachnospiraceae bacterium]